MEEKLYRNRDYIDVNRCLRQLQMTTKKCATITLVTLPHRSNGPVAESYSRVNFLLMRLMARCKSSLASVSETQSELSCNCFTIPCRRAEDERSWGSGPASERSEKCSPFRRERLTTSVARGWQMRE